MTYTADSAGPDATDPRPFGPTGQTLPSIGQGTWKMELGDSRAAMAAVVQGIDLGLRHVDTAEMYGAGQVESLLGQALGARRERVFLVSKVLPHHASYSGTIAACEESLRRLRTDRLDLYLLHWPGHHPLEETIRAFDELQRVGKIAAFGVSNFDVPDLEQALAVAGPGRIACNQVLYHLQERAIEHRVMGWCTEHDVPIVAYSPFGSGAFPKPHSPGGRLLEQIAGAHGASPRQVALRFLLRLPNLFTIPKAARRAHVVDNAAALQLRLTAEELAAIDRAFPRGPARRTLPMI